MKNLSNILGISTICLSMLTGCAKKDESVFKFKYQGVDVTVLRESNHYYFSLEKLPEIRFSGQLHSDDGNLVRVANNHQSYNIDYVGKRLEKIKINVELDNSGSDSF